MKDFCSIDFKDSVRFVVRRDLKRLGIKVPKYRQLTKGVEYHKEGAVFGVALDKVPSKNVGENFYYSVPKFLVDSASYLRHHFNTEGLFRKSGSVQRQKLLKEKVELGEDISAAQPHDVAGLMKQFFRQLQDPLLTNTFHDSFIKTLRLDDDKSRTKAMLYLCLMLPLPHLQALKYTMDFIAEFAAHSEESKMGISNLAIVLTPNLMHNTRKDNSSSSEKLLKDQTLVIRTLLKNAEYIGMVPEEVYDRAKMIGDEENNIMTSSGDELDCDDGQNSKRKRAPRPRTRTGSITGFIGQSLSKIKGNSTSSKTPVRQHRRSKSVKADLMRNKNKYNVAEDIVISKDDTDLEKMVSRTQDRMSLRIYNKRKLADPTSNLLSPANKRYQTRHMMKNGPAGDVGIGQPMIVSRSNAMFATSMKPVTPVKPLAEMVKKEHAKALLSAETEHVKVVDAATYIPSPDPSASTTCSTFYAPSPHRTSGNTRYDSVFESPQASEHDDAGDRGMQRRKVTRRNSSGATSCFSSSPRSRQTGSNTKTKSVQEVGRRLASQATETENNHTNSLTPVAPPRKRVAHSHVESVTKARYGSASARIGGSDSMTPCKYHVGTPPNAASSKEFKTVLSQKI